MKKLLLAGAAALAMATAAQADNSTSTVTQSNSGNEATVDQTGSLAGGASTITQSGMDNDATVTQADDGSDLLGAAPPINFSQITQTGNENEATVSQDTGTASILTESFIDQSGDRNMASVTQVDDDQYSSIIQTSSDNMAMVSQGEPSQVAGDESYGNTSLINQGGAGSHSATVEQAGRQSFSDIAQTGFNNEAFVRQGIWSNSHESYINQSGDNNVARVDTQGADIFGPLDNSNYN